MPATSWAGRRCMWPRPSNYPDMCAACWSRAAANSEALTSKRPDATFPGGQDRLGKCRCALALMAARCQFTASRPSAVYDSRGRLTPLYAAADGLDGTRFFQFPISRQKRALSQLHYKYRIDRNQTFDLFRLFPIEVEERDGPDGPVRVNPENIDVPYYS
uniref:ETS domain-containing protein n=1 Tax=Macrostomum lignano TaxID=282301 RepID=A0A1I8F764_9PLAT